jgi:hypothetical protein
MKIQVVSDLHLEFAPLTLPNVGADVVVLAGDIDIGTKGVRFAAEALGGQRALCCWEPRVLRRRNPARHRKAARSG